MSERMIVRLVAWFWLVIASLLVTACGPTSVNDEVSTAGQFGLEKATRLPSPANSKSFENAPTISADGRTLIFQSNRGRNGEWKLYSARKTFTGWTKPEPLDDINSESFDGYPFLTYDQNHLIFSSRRDGGLGKLDIWISHRRGEHWSAPVNLGAPVNSSEYDGFASLAPSGTVLYFQRYSGSSQKCDYNYRNNELMTSVRTVSGWREPTPLPAPINSEWCETDPVILADGRTLVFSSNRPGGYGGFDLYKTEKLDDGAWSEPMNLGSFINGSGDDMTATIPASGDIMYFVSDDDEGDLYSVPIPATVQPIPVVTVSGKVRDADTDQPLAAEVMVIDLATGADTTVVGSDPVDGEYFVILTSGERYDVSASAEGYTFYSTNFDLTAVEAYQEIQRDIFLDPLRAGSQIVLNNIYFEFARYRLLEESRYELQRVVDLMEANPAMKVEIAGHTDSIASEKYNLELSGKRAGAVVDYLMDHGIAMGRMVSRGYGESEPVADNGTDEGRQANRRVEFRILSVEP